jgi:ubiquitin-conjugating enzyme E2 D/E/ubiquitin-conjugating enzyme E2 H
MFDLRNIFDSFLPQLLLYPNPADPLNSEAASLLMKNPEVYKKRVRDMVIKHAMIMKDEEELSDISRDDLSELTETSELDEDLL